MVCSVNTSKGVWTVDLSWVSNRNIAQVSKDRLRIEENQQAGNERQTERERREATRGKENVLRVISPRAIVVPADLYIHDSKVLLFYYYYYYYYYCF